MTPRKLSGRCMSFSNYRCTVPILIIDLCLSLLLVSTFTAHSICQLPKGLPGIFIRLCFLSLNTSELHIRCPLKMTTMKSLTARKIPGGKHI